MKMDYNTQKPKIILQKHHFLPKNKSTQQKLFNKNFSKVTAVSTVSRSKESCVPKKNCVPFFT